jgi:hypothetical protein
VVVALEVRELVKGLDAKQGDASGSMVEIEVELLPRWKAISRAS